MLRLGRAERALPLSGCLHREPQEELRRLELVSIEGKAENQNGLQEKLSSLVKAQMKLWFSFRLRFTLIFLPCF